MTNTKHDEANWFSQGGQKYSQYRPEYPPELARFLAKFLRVRIKPWMLAAVRDS